MNDPARSRSYSLTQQVPITSSRKKSNSFNNNVHELNEFLDHLHQVKDDLQHEADSQLGGNVKGKDGKLNSHNLHFKIKEINSSIQALSSKMKQLRESSETSQQIRTSSQTSDFKSSSSSSQLALDTNKYVKGSSSSGLSINDIDISETNNGPDPSAIDLHQDIFNNSSSSPTWLLSDIIQSINFGKDKDAYYLISRGNDLATLLNTHPTLKQDLIVKTFVNRILFMLSHDISEVRATGYRISRYILSDYESLTILVQSKLLIFIIISMSRSNCYIEKEQALKFIKECFMIPNGVNMLSIGVIKSLLTVIENEDVDLLVEDESRATEFKNVCFETILELCFLSPEQVFLSGGFRTVFQIIHDGPIELALLSILTLTSILDRKDSRKYLRNGYDMSSLVSYFADIDMSENTNDHSTNKNTINKKSNSSSKHQRYAFLICVYLKTWNGLMSFAHNNFEPWRVLVSSLNKNDSNVSGIILDIFFDILQIKTLPWIKNSYLSEVLEKASKIGTYQKEKNSQYPAHNSKHHEMTNQTLGLILDILVNKCNIMKVLISIIEENAEEEITQKATLLVSNIYKLVNEFLPKEYLKDKKNILPLLQSENLIENNVLNYKINIATRTLEEPIVEKDMTQRLETTKQTINNILIKVGYDIDDTDFKSNIYATKVLSIKEYNDWNWHILSALVEGPLRNPKIFDEIIKSTPKFLKRVMSFYRPFKFRFSKTTKFKGSHKYIVTGCKLFESLLCTEEGYKYLASNKILPQISEAFAQIDPYSGISAKDPILSRQNLKKSLSGGYLDMLAVLSKNEKGIYLLSQWQFFTYLHHIIEGSVIDSKNHYLITAFLKKIDYSLNSPFRIILAKALMICSLEIKLLLMNSIILPLLKTPQCSKWIVTLLIQRLYDSEKIVSEISTNALLSYCNGEESNLIYVISMRPSVNILKKTDAGKIILSKFLSTTEGYKFLENIGYITEEFYNWVQKKNKEYALQMNTIVESFMNPYLTNSLVKDNQEPHFFTCLLQTEEGLLFFQQENNRGYLESLLIETENLKNAIDHVFDKEITGVVNGGQLNYQIVLKLKENLWVLGSIAGSLFGIQLLDTEYSRNLTTAIIPLMIEIVCNCPFWHVRAVALFQLSKVSSTVEGAEILDDLNWVSVFDMFDQPKSLCYPTEGIEIIFNVEKINPYNDVKYHTLFGQNPENPFDEQLDASITGEVDPYDNIISNVDTVIEMSEEDFEKYEYKVLSLINHLSAVLNRIERKAIKELEKIKQNIPIIFSSTTLFFKVIKQIDKGRYKLRVRRFVFGLFLENNILDLLVKGERKIKQNLL